MEFFFLDVAETLLLFGPLLLFIILCFVLEAITMSLMNFASFGRAIWMSIMINVTIVIAGLFIMPVVGDQIVGNLSGLDNVPHFFTELAVYFIITVVTEALLMKALVKSKAWKDVFTVSSIMNVVTCTALVLMLIYLN